MNLTGGTRFAGELRFRLENYFPEAHYQQAVTDVFDEDSDDGLLPDGGAKTQYYWRGEGGVVYHTDSGDGMVDPFFNSIEEAKRYLETLAEQHGSEQYDSLVLRKSGNLKVIEATEVLTDQADLTDW
jgi:hypothetical protein